MEEDIQRFHHYLKEDPQMRFYIQDETTTRLEWKLIDPSNPKISFIKSFIVAYPSGEVLDQYNIRTRLPEGIRFMDGPVFKDNRPGYDKRKVDNSKVSILHGKAKIRTDENYYSTSIKNDTNYRIRVYKFAPAHSRTRWFFSSRIVINGYYSPTQFREWFRVDDPEGWIKPGETVTDPDNWGTGDGIWAYFFENEKEDAFIGTVPLSVF